MMRPRSAFPRAALRLFAPAKINWVLTVAGRRPDGYHDLNTVFQTLQWGDQLRCHPLQSRICNIRCDDPTIPLGEGNLIWRAWRLLADRYPERVRGLSVHLTKRVPQGAGLGGGSSDAAATLVAVNRIYGLGLRRPQLEAHASALGSDCAFFIRGGTALASGRGERLTPLKNRLGPLWLVVVYPGFPSSTRKAYERITPRHWSDRERALRAARAIETGAIDQLKSNLFNVFNDLVKRTDPVYKLLDRELAHANLRWSLLTGSGSAVFAIADSSDHAHAAAQRLAGGFPCAVAVRLRHRGIGWTVPPER